MLCVQKWREERDKLVGGLEQILQQKDARIASLEAQSRHARQVGGDEGAGQRGAWQRGRDKLVGGLEQILQQKDARIASLEAQSRHARQVGGHAGAGQGRVGGVGQAGRGTGADTAAEGRSHRIAGGAVPSRQTGGRGRGGGAEEGRGRLVGGLEQILQQKDARIASLEAQSRHARQVGGVEGGAAEGGMAEGARQRGRDTGGGGRCQYWTARIPTSDHFDTLQDSEILDNRAIRCHVFVAVNVAMKSYGADLTPFFFSNN